MERYFRTGLFEDAIDSLREAQSQIALIRAKRTAIKWATIAMHSAVQGHMALVLNQGNGLNVLAKKDAEAWLKAHYEHKPYPTNLRMDGFMNLYAKIKQMEFMGNFVGAEPFRSLGHDVSMKRLNKIRNRFIHFNVDGWSIEISGLHVVFREAVEVIEYSANSINFPWHRSDDFETRRTMCDHLIEQIKDLCRSPFELSK